jgi:hypothetical protein
MARKTIQQLAAATLPAVGTDLIPVARGVSAATKLQLEDLPISDATQTALDAKQALDAELTAIAGLSSDGLIAKTGAGTAAVRTITGTSNEITLTNGSGVSGNPTVSLPTALTFTGKTVTGGTFSGPTITGTVPGSATFSGNPTFSGNVTLSGSVRTSTTVTVPSDFWSVSLTPMWLPYGWIGSNNSNNTVVSSNGYRNNASGAGNLGAGGNTGWSMLDLQPDGDYALRADASPSGILPTERYGYTASTGLHTLTGNAYVTGTLDIGAASDTTISRASAGQIAVEGVTVATASNTLTLTNKSTTAANASTALTFESRFGQFCNVKDFGAVGTYDLSAMTGTDDYTAIAAAFAAAESAGHKTVYFPPGYYGMSQPVVIDGDDWAIIGEDRSSTALVAINDDNLIEIDCRTALSQRGSIRNLCFARNSATYSNTAAIRILADAAEPYGARHWTFGELFLRGVYYGVYHERTAGQLSDGLNQIQWHGFNEYRNIHVPLADSGRYPNNVLKWIAGCGPHQLVLGGQYRAEAENVQMGSGDALDGLGDFLMVGVHCVLGTTGLDVIGPSGASTYRYNITVTGCQFDVLTTSISKFRNCGLVRFMNNNWLTTIPVDYDSTVIAYQIDTPDGIQRNQSTVEDVYSVDWLHDSFSAKRVASPANRVLAQGTTTGGTPIIGVEGSDTNVSLRVDGQGTGAVQLAAQRDNYIEAVGGNTLSGSVLVRPAGADTNVAFQVQGKGTGGVTLAANRTNYVAANGANTANPATLISAGGDTNIGLNVQGKGTGVVGVASATNGLGFFAGAGTTKQTITGSRDGNAALESLLTALAAHGLITDSTTA